MFGIEILSFCGSSDRFTIVITELPCSDVRSKANTLLLLQLNLLALLQGVYELSEGLLCRRVLRLV